MLTPVSAQSIQSEFLRLQQDHAVCVRDPCRILLGARVVAHALRVLLRPLTA